MKCKSCGFKLGRGHREAHARYAKRHRLAVKKLQEKYRREGKQCAMCGGKINLYSMMCDRHGKSRRLWSRKRIGAKPWRRGKRGRPPLEAAAPKRRLTGAGSRVGQERVREPETLS